jgi:hypothetical protein
MWPSIKVPLFEDRQSGAAALDRVQVAAAPELAEHSDACGHVVLLPEVELAVAKLLLIVDERRQRDRRPTNGVGVSGYFSWV